MKLVVGEKVLLVHGGNNKLRIVDESTLVSVDGIKHLLNVSLVEILSEELIIPVHDFLFGELSITVLINCLENLSQVLFFSFGEELTGNESESGLLEFLIGSESLEIGESSHSKVLINV